MSRQSPSAAARSAFAQVEARAPDAARAERALAEAYAAGAIGAEECDGAQGGVTWRLYAPAADADAVAAAARAVLGADAVTAPTPVADANWSDAWKHALAPVEVSARLRVRTSAEASAPRAGQRDLVIDPGQAFGTGGHESTRLALACVDALHARLAGARVLDVGTGSGVLALAALALGAERATGFDLDPLAATAARAAARDNGLERGLALFTGPLDALAPAARFDLVLANLLSGELAPIFDALVARLADGGRLVVSGWLGSEVAGWRPRLDAAGLRVESARRARDASGVGWTALVLTPRPPRATAPA